MIEDATIIGLIAAACTTIAFLPQAIKSLRTKQTKDLSLKTFLIATMGVLLWLVYGLLIDDLPLIAANAVTLILMSSIVVMIEANQIYPGIHYPAVLSR